MSPPTGLSLWRFFEVGLGSVPGSVPNRVPEACQRVCPCGASSRLVWGLSQGLSLIEFPRFDTGYRIAPSNSSDSELRLPGQPPSGSVPIGASSLALGSVPNRVSLRVPVARAAHRTQSSALPAQAQEGLSLVVLRYWCFEPGRGSVPNRVPEVGLGSVPNPGFGSVPNRVPGFDTGYRIGSEQFVGLRAPPSRAAPKRVCPYWCFESGPGSVTFAKPPLAWRTARTVPQRSSVVLCVQRCRGPQG
jgi:hypothetical protein